MTGKSSAYWKIVVCAALAGLVLLACARSATEFAARMMEKRYPPPGRMIPVGAYRLQLYCTGSGGPTVIVEPGMGQDWVGWRFAIARLARSRTVCVYDRAGYGWSDPGPKPRTALREACELDALLTAARVPKPYVLVAHSYGAYIARIYAGRFPDSLAGVVLVEPSHEDEAELSSAQPQPSRQPGLAHRVLDWIPPLGVQRLKRMWEGGRALPSELRDAPRCYQNRFLVASSLAQLSLERNEFDSLALTMAEVRETVFPREVPLTVITALYRDRPADDGSALRQSPIHLELHARLAQSSRHGRQIFADRSGHMVPVDQPELVADAVLDLPRRD